MISWPWSRRRTDQNRSQVNFHVVNGRNSFDAQDRGIGSECTEDELVTVQNRSDLYFQVIISIVFDWVGVRVTSERFKIILHVNFQVILLALPKQMTYCKNIFLSKKKTVCVPISLFRMPFFLSLFLLISRERGRVRYFTNLREKTPASGSRVCVLEKKLSFFHGFLLCVRFVFDFEGRMKLQFSCLHLGVPQYFLYILRGNDFKIWISKFWIHQEKKHKKQYVRGQRAPRSGRRHWGHGHPG